MITEDGKIVFKSQLTAFLKYETESKIWILLNDYKEKEGVGADFSLFGLDQPGIYLEIANIQSNLGRDVLNNPDLIADSICDGFLEYFNYTSCLNNDGCNPDCREGDLDCGCVEQSSLKRSLVTCPEGTVCVPPESEVYSSEVGGVCCAGTCCGNNIVEGTEFCDGTDLDGKTCVHVGYKEGTLKCGNYCYFDVSECGYKLS